MNTGLDMTLNERMRKYLDTFFLSLQGDNIALNSFVSTFSSFHNAIRTHHDKLQVDTLTGIQRFASVIDTVAVNVLELEKESEKIFDGALTDIGKLLDRKMSDLTIDDRQKTKSWKGETTFPAYIKPSYEWLVLNLHNPYPSKEIKKNIAHQSKCSARDIDSWFIDARKRIGWNTLRKQRFSNKQEKIIAAAARFFQPSLLSFSDDPSVTLESEADFDDGYHAEFTAMEDAARSLYSCRFAEVAVLIAPSHSPSREVFPAILTSCSKDNRSSPLSEFGATHALSPKSRISGTVLSYPTPQPSPGQSIESSPSPSTPLPLPDQPEVQLRKRRQISVESETSSEDSRTRPGKRRRMGIHESTEAVALASLPSPARTVDLSEDVPNGNISSGFVACDHSEVSESRPMKRKRRLSDGDNRRLAKRPHHSLALPRLQTVSDPFPIRNLSAVDDSFDDWFSGHFNREHQLADIVPLPANLDVHDLPESDSLEVHNHQYKYSPYQPDICLPEARFVADEIVTYEAGPSTSEGSRPCDSPERASNTVSPFLLNSLRDADVAGIIGTSDLTLDLDFSSLPAVLEDVSQDLSFSSLQQISTFDVLNQPLQANFSWMSYLSSSPGDSFDIIQPLPSYSSTAPIASHLNVTPCQDQLSSKEHDAKRFRAQILREELQRLEFELAV